MNKRWVHAAVIAGAAVAATVSVVAAAQPAPGTPGTASPLDAFHIIFGVDPTSIQSLFINNNGSILATISTLINTAALTAVVIALLLTPLGSVLDASQRHGTTRWSIPWWIIRTVLALFFVTPTPAGYSPLQGMVMWTAYQGSNLASEAWSRSVDYMATNLSVIPQVPAAQTHALVQAMFESAVCAERLSTVATKIEEVGGTPAKFGEYVESGAGNRAMELIETAQTVNKPGLIAKAWSGALGETAQDVTVTTTTVSYDGVTTGGSGWFDNGNSSKALCGAFSFREELTGNYGAMAATWRTDALRTLVGDIGDVAHDMVHATQTSDPALGTAALRQRLANIEVEYAVAMQDVAEDQVRAMVAGELTDDGTGSAIEAFITSLDASLHGEWFSAGAYYLTISRLSDAIAEQAQVEAEMNPPATKTLSMSQAADLAPYMKRAKHVFAVGQSATATFNAQSSEIGLAGMGGASANGSAGDSDSHWFARVKEWAETFISDAFLQVVDLLPNKMASGRDPVVVIQSFGDTGLVIVETAFVGIPAVVASMGGDSKWLSWPIFLAIILPLFIAFGALAFYLPAIPFILWVFGVFGWLTMLIEAVAVAPFWGAAHAIPEGDGFAGQHAKQGYMLVLSLIARPLLMIFGLLAAMVLLRFAAPMMTQLFFFWRNATWAEHIIGIGSAVFLICLYAGILLGLIRACFSLIHVVPDRALRWIGAGIEQLGERDNEHQSRGYMMGAFAMFRGGQGVAVEGTKRLTGRRSGSNNKATGR